MRSEISLALPFLRVAPCARAGDRGRIEYGDWRINHLDQDPLFLDAQVRVQVDNLMRLVNSRLCISVLHVHLTQRNGSRVLKEKLASTSVDTRPGTIFRISLPNSTSSRSIAFSLCTSGDLSVSVSP